MAYKHINLHVLFNAKAIIVEVQCCLMPEYIVEVFNTYLMDNAVQAFFEDISLKVNATEFRTHCLWCRRLAY